MGKKETAWERIVSASPLSLITGTGIEATEKKEAFLNDLNPDFENHDIRAIRFSCSGYKDALPLWRSLYDRILSCCTDYINPENRYSIIQQTNDIKDARDSYQAYLCVSSILGTFKKDGRKVVLILEDFDSLYCFMDLPSISVFHTLTSKVGIVAVSSEPLDVLGTLNYKSKYFTNQFLVSVYL